MRIGLIVLAALTLAACGRRHGKDGLNGVNGANGTNGLDATVPEGTNITEVIDPCGDAIGIIDEVLLKLSNGQVLASFSENANGKNTRFSLIPTGSYVTTDGSNCHFTVDALGNVN